MISIWSAKEAALKVGLTVDTRCIDVQIDLITSPVAQTNEWQPLSIDCRTTEIKRWQAGFRGLYFDVISIL
jgi:hypothetical protein